MITKKGGTVLLNLETKQIGLIYREQDKGYTFPKGHMEDGETLQECAVRETEEESLRSNYLLIDKEIDIIKYVTPLGENVESYMYISIDKGPTTKYIPEYDRENFEWLNYEEVEDKLAFTNLKEFWNKVKSPIKAILDNNGKIKPAILTDLSICPTCYDRENNHCVYGDNKDKLLFENDEYECCLEGNPREAGHTIIISKKHYKDMLEAPDDLCEKIYVFAKKAMKAIKKVYKTESVYLCTMCDGPMNHFHVQLIPRYSYENRGSNNFVKSRKEYIEDSEKVAEMRRILNEDIM